MQHHPFTQRLDLLRVDRMAASDLIDLGDVVARRGQPMDQRPIVGQQQQTGGVLVESTDRLHTASAQRQREQIAH